ncbi:DUF4215 domain-containing protein, partial [Myxococcota bacterium]
CQLDDSDCSTCGNGIAEAAEICDGTDLQGQDCTDHGFVSGSLACDPDCQLDLQDCTSETAVCGNGIAEANEVCDGSDLRGQDCLDLGHQSGELACQEDCLAFDVSGCWTVQPICGNGVVEPGEVCDDGNLDACDGCSPTCFVEECGNGVLDCGESCDDGNSLPGDGCGPTCLQEECGNAFLDPGEICDDGNVLDGDGCSSDCLSDESCGNGLVDMTVGEQCDEGANNSNAPNATCRIDCLVQRCGDGILDDLQSEVCDDGNQSSGDGCSADCFSDETCGNGYVDVATGEQCDEGSNNSDTPNSSCRTDCLPQRCSDGILDDLQGEVCDDGNTTFGDGCSGDCLSNETCGNSYVDTAIGEQCDEGPNNSDAPNASCRTDCLPQRCGDGILDDLQGEGCDDGNTIDWDGCTACTISEFQVNSYATNNQTSPALAVAQDGSFVVVWQSGFQAGFEYDVFAQSFDSMGNPMGGEFQVNSFTTNNQQHSVVAQAFDGSLVVVWASDGQDGSGYGIFAQRFDSAGNPVGGEFQVNSYTTGWQNIPALAVASDGSFVVVWESYGDGDSLGVFGKRFDSMGNPVSGEFQINSFVSGDQKYPAVVVAENGNHVVVWQSDDQDGSWEGIFAQRFDSAGNPVGGEFQVNSYTADRQWYPDVSLDGSAGFVIVWQSNGQDGDSFGIFAQRYDSAGFPIGGEFQVNTYTTYDQGWPAVAQAGDGSFVVTWASGFQDGSGYGIFAQKYSNAGNPVGGEFQVNSYTTSTQTYPAVAVAGNGSFVIVWQSDGQDGNSSGIFAQRFDAAGNPIGIGL